MATYQNVLISLDVQSTYETVLRKGLAIAGDNANVHLLFVCTPQIIYEPFGAAMISDLTEQVRSQAEVRLREIAELNNIPSEKAEVVLGEADEKIREKAEEINADLIVVGTHGRSGLKRVFLGSTANAVLHGVKCDVHIVKV